MAHVLTYDTLPVHSRVRREVEVGVLRLTAMPEEPGPMARRALLLRSAIPAAVICGVVLLLCIAVFGGLFLTNRRGFSSELMTVLVIAFSIFCLALFAFIWRAQYSARLDTVQNALKQTTLLAASRGRLIVETTGPLGTASHDLRDVVSIARDGDCLEVARSNGSQIQLLNGRDSAELDWIAQALTEAMEVRHVC